MSANDGNTEETPRERLNRMLREAEELRATVERDERERAAREKAEREQREREAREKAEQERLAKEKAENERKEREAAESQKRPAGEAPRDGRQAFGGPGGEGGGRAAVPGSSRERAVWQAEPGEPGWLTGEELMQTLLVEVQGLRRSYDRTSEELKSARKELRTLRESAEVLLKEVEWRKAQVEAYVEYLEEEAAVENDEEYEGVEWGGERGGGQRGQRRRGRGGGLGKSDGAPGYIE
ncbi:hypothetical protein BN946_scf184996.g8 [Trametes cinnabarina]|uniref:Uncharacterized protein n=1 Tax=Pycnoporus cinnabarinus TaxID=5643 RepID=A0A060S2G1_PYCCI|nr:hypothetical protein BN946_scf184996.g8 [Trametes cinnabarina]